MLASYAECTALASIVTYPDPQAPLQALGMRILSVVTRVCKTPLCTFSRGIGFEK